MKFLPLTVKFLKKGPQKFFACGGLFSKKSSVDFAKILGQSRGGVKNILHPPYDGVWCHGYIYFAFSIIHNSCVKIIFHFAQECNTICIWKGAIFLDSEWSIQKLINSLFPLISMSLSVTKFCKKKMKKVNYIVY